MQIAPRTNVRQFFATQPVPCPYLRGRAEQKLVADLSGPDPNQFYETLSEGGFRRSHTLAYRPACRGCNGCVPVRVAITEFTPSRSLRRVTSRNADLVARVRRPIATEEQYDLFARYQRSRHGTSEMASMGFAEYRSMVEETAVDTVMMELRDPAGQLVGACLTDRLPGALSAVYSFYEPTESRRSLGTFAIIWLIDSARSLGLDHVYLGYWIAGSDTMDYKRRFPALEGLVDGSWRPL